VGKRLAEARKILSEAISYDDLETALEDVPSWEFTRRKPSH
jgi:hypothetical protein